MDRRTLSNSFDSLAIAARMYSSESSFGSGFLSDMVDGRGRVYKDQVGECLDRKCGRVTGRGRHDRVARASKKLSGCGLKHVKVLPTFSFLPIQGHFLPLE
jgi:hypothetical protein